RFLLVPVRNFLFFSNEFLVFLVELLRNSIFGGFCEEFLVFSNEFLVFPEEFLFFLVEFLRNSMIVSFCNEFPVFPNELLRNLIFACSCNEFVYRLSARFYGPTYFRQLITALLRFILIAHRRWAQETPFEVVTCRAKERRLTY